jgi:hypothetical protein
LKQRRIVLFAQFLLSIPSIVPFFCSFSFKRLPQRHTHVAKREKNGHHMIYGYCFSRFPICCCCCFYSIIFPVNM